MVYQEAAGTKSPVVFKEGGMKVMVKLVHLYKLITEATDEEISILLGYATNLLESRPKAVEKEGQV